MGGTTEQVEVRLLAPGGDAAGRKALIGTFRGLDARKATCFYQNDADRLLSTIEGGFGDVKAFSVEIGEVLESVVSDGVVAHGHV